MIKIVSGFNTLLLILLPLCSLVAQESDIKKWEFNYNTGQELVANKKLKDALPLLENAYNIAQVAFEKDNQNIYKTAYFLANTYDELKERKKAIEFYLSALEGFKLYGETVDFDYDKALYRLGINYRNIGEYDNSINVLNERLEVIEKKEGKYNEKYINTLGSLSIAYKKKEDYPKAIELSKSSINIAKKLFGKKSIKYAKKINNLSQTYYALGEYEKGIVIQKPLLSLYTEKNFDYAIAIYTMSLLYNGINEYEKEIQLLKEAKVILSENPKYHNHFISVNNNLALAYDNLGDYEKALTTAIYVLDNTSVDHTEYPTRAQNLGSYYTKLGEYNKAESVYKNALAARLKLKGTSHKLNARLFDVIGQHYYKKRDYEKAKEYFEEALPAYLKIKDLDESYSEYGRCLNYYATTLLELDQNNKAIDLLIKNIKIFNYNTNQDTEWYLRKQIALGKAYNKVGQYKKASIILQDYGEKFMQKLGANHPDYADILNSLGKAYLGLGELQQAIAILDSANNILIHQIDKVFKFRSEKEKHSFLSITNQNFDELQSIAFNLKTSSAELNKINLNNQIMLKGLLLKNSKNVLTQLGSLKNDEIDKKIIEYRILKNHLSKTLSLPLFEREVDVDGLNEKINKKEADLVKLFTSKFQTKTNLIGNWESSKKRLSENDLAIEFSHFKLTTNNKVTDGIMYVAYLYKSNWNAPIMIPLFEVEELKKIISNNSKNELYSSNKLYNLIWKPFEEYLELSNNVYFSPSGLLNQISFAAIKNNQSTLSINYNLVQLSSTGVLAKGRTEPRLDTTLLIGGIIYDYANSSSVEVDSSYAYLNSENLKNLRGTKTRGESWTYLPNTLKEIENLQSIFNLRQKKSFTLTGEQATESAFKEQSGNSPKLLHIATHGFFYENIETTLGNGFNLDLSTEDQYRLAEDPLLRSGLLLAGANYAWKNGTNPNEDEDGILTAMEISNLDLSNTEIVVLSACETGLGYIDGSEGVYGLQRAFKMAGVDIMVMSLWQVLDAETSEFMTLFYENWIANKNVRMAFNEAQRYMQKTYKDEPEKWAAFVLFE